MGTPHGYPLWWAYIRLDACEEHRDDLVQFKGRADIERYHQHWWQKAPLCDMCGNRAEYYAHVRINIGKEQNASAEPQRLPKEGPWTGDPALRQVIPPEKVE